MAAIEFLKPSQVDQFGKILCGKLLAEGAAVVKGYIHMLIQEIVVADDEAIIRGSFDALANVLHQMKMGTCKQVPSSIYVWRPLRYQ